MKGFDVLKIKSAVKSHNKFDLSRSHLTTMDFGQIIPMFVEETVPGDKFNIDAEYFSRLAPLAVPTYGKFQFKTVAAFVPYHQIAWDSDAWLAGKTSWEGITPIHRTITWYSLHMLLADRLTVASTASGNTDAVYSYMSASGAIAYRKWKDNYCKYYWHVMECLGYAMPSNVDMQTTSDWYVNKRNIAVSAYPLLAFFKLYNDYMSQSQRFNTSVLSNILQCIKYNKPYTGFSNTTGSISYTLIELMFQNLFLNYENDYFTSAWQSANNPLSSPDTINAGAVPATAQSASVSTFVNDTTLIQNGGSTLTLGQRALDWLKDFDDWVRRNNYSGSRAVQQIYSRFGIKTDDYRSHYANIITTDSMPVQVGDITSTADTTGAILGDYAGKGIMSGNKSVNVEVSDYGLILILGYFTVSPMNAYGFDRRVLRTNPLDYYNPEFDGIGADPISLGEFSVNPFAAADSNDSTEDDQVFGYTERYNAYRYGRDVITGEFRNYKGGDMSAWHTGRLVTGIRAAGNLVAQSTSVNTLPQANSEYNRIFSVTNGDIDHFYMTARFKVSAIRPMLNLNQVVRLGEGDTNVPRNGNVIS